MNIVEARYTPQRIQNYKGNPLIEALPPIGEVEDCLSSIQFLPDYSPEERQLSLMERQQLLGNLGNLMVPLERHIELAMAMDKMLRAGYVGREPKSSRHGQVFQELYNKQKSGQTFTQTATTRAQQISSALIGLSGMGKSTFVERFLATYPQVIYHPELNLHQVVHLHIEMPSDGKSIKGLAHAILAELDKLIPDADYYEEYALKGRPGADALMRSVARLMHMHCVGILVCDEIQNLANSHKGGDTVMTELVSACNDLGLPILFIGTNKAATVLNKDFRQARRSVGQSIAPWDRLHQFAEPGRINEWDEFARTLWGFQWTANYVPYSPEFSHALYFHSQGVIDIAIKLFAAAQARAMNDGSEKISIAHLDKVFCTQMQLVAPMIEALRENDLNALARFEDIAPLCLEDMVSIAVRSAKARTSPLIRTKSADQEFVPRVAAGLAALGMDEQDALSQAQDIADSGKEMNVAQGMKKALDAAIPPRKPAGSDTRASRGADIIDFSGRPKDYRRAQHEAKLNGTKVLEQLAMLGMAPPLEQVLSLD